jgi:hypothetical protein
MAQRRRLPTAHFDDFVLDEADKAIDAPHFFQAVMSREPLLEVVACCATLTAREFKETVPMEDRERTRFMLPILLLILFIVGIVCCVRPEFFVKRPGLRLGLLFRLVPEGSHSTVIRALGVIAISRSVVGFVELIKIW